MKNYIITIFEPFYPSSSFSSNLTQINRFSICQTHGWNPGPLLHLMVYWTTPTSLILVFHEYSFSKFFLRLYPSPNHLGSEVSSDHSLPSGHAYSLGRLTQESNFWRMPTRFRKTCAGFSLVNLGGRLKNHARDRINYVIIVNLRSEYACPLRRLWSDETSDPRWLGLG